MAPARNTRSSKKDRAPTPDPVDEQEVSDTDMSNNPFNEPNNILPYDDRPQEEEPAGTGQGGKEKETSGGAEKGDKGSKKKSKGKDDEEKPARKPSQPKMTWDVEHKYALALIMLGGQAVPNRHGEAIAKIFRENPSGKAVAVEMGQIMRESAAKIKEGGLDKEFARNPGRGTKRHNPTGDEVDPTLASPGTKRQKIDRPVLDYPAAPEIPQDSRVFEHFPVTWSQLPEDVRRQVQDACAKLKPALDREYEDTSFKSRVNAQKQYLAKQKAREAAEVLASMRQEGDKRKETALERETRVLIENMTGAVAQGDGDDADAEGSEDSEAPGEE